MKYYIVYYNLKIIILEFKLSYSLTTFLKFLCIFNTTFKSKSLSDTNVDNNMDNLQKSIHD